ncbi:hypothetical protein T492DRAFT_905261, partial [Pavlovales sp. CCMP2436]
MADSSETGLARRQRKAAAAADTADGGVGEPPADEPSHRRRDRSAASDPTNARQGGDVGDVDGGDAGEPLSGLDRRRKARGEGTSEPAPRVEADEPPRSRSEQRRRRGRTAGDKAVGKEGGGEARAEPARSQSAGRRGRRADPARAQPPDKSLETTQASEQLRSTGNLGGFARRLSQTPALLADSIRSLRGARGRDRRPGEEGDSDEEGLPPFDRQARPLCAWVGGEWPAGGGGA